MSDITKKLTNRVSRMNRTRAGIHGTQERPRLCVTISNSHISAQIINDDMHTTLVSASTLGKKSAGTMTDRATVIGEEIAKLAKAKKINKVVYDRGNKKYHGRVKALAEAARKNGLEF